jgi:hypothetical protein
MFQHLEFSTNCRHLPQRNAQSGPLSLILQAIELSEHKIEHFKGIAKVFYSRNSDISLSKIELLILSISYKISRV